MNLKEIIYKYLSSYQTKETVSIFYEWLQEDRDREKKEEILKEFWEGATDTSLYTSNDVNSAYDKIYEKIKVRKFVYFKRIFKIAAVFVLALSLPLTYYLAKRGTETNLIECYVADGQTRKITLPDSSVITLNAGSLFIYPEKFNSRYRKVYLSGEGIFDVRKDKNHPFIVETSDMDVLVKGTVFNISSYPDEKTIKTTLKEGSVSAKFDNAAEVSLEPGESVIYDKESGKIKKLRIDPKEVFSWKDGKLCFQSENINNVLKRIRRMYNVDIYLTTSKYNDEYITAKFIYGETVDELMSAICQIVPGMTYEKEDNVIYVK